MIERADWRPRRAGEAQSALGWLFGADRWRGIPLYPLVALITGLFCAVKAGLGFILPEPWSGSGILLLVRAGPLNGVVVRRAQSIQRPSDLPEAAHYPCSVRLTSAKKEQGVDKGIVALCEGWLLFEGERTSFALAPQDVEGLNEVNGNIGLHLSEDEHIALMPENVSVFIRAVETWHKGPRPAGLSRFPPKGADPDFARQSAALFVLASAICLGASIAPPMGRHGIVSNLICLGFSIVFGLFAWLRIRALKTREKRAKETV